MGLWVAIKHAINSTLGTDKFKPLDKIMEDLIVGQKRFVANDTTLKIVNGSGTIYFTPNIKGTIRIIARVSVGTYGGSVTLKATGSDGSTQTSAALAAPQNTILDIDADFNVSANISYTFDYSLSAATSVTFQSIRVCGQVTDYGYFS